MVSKNRIIAVLGKADLLLPEQIAQSLTANDQIKYYFALLQMARANADRPAIPAQDLKAERLASRIADTELDGAVSGASKHAGGQYRVPQAERILAAVMSSLDTMIACLPPAERAALAARIAKLQPPAIESDLIPGTVIDTITSGDRKRGDSLHLVVMDAHKAINRLQAETAVETLAGAHVHNLTSHSRPLVEAFMAGLNRTAPLKFDHPGLGTTATEHDGRVLIQNDIGTTDAHVLVVRIEKRTTTLTYTDIHKARLEFFQSLFADFCVDWAVANTQESSSLDNKSYLLTTGTYVAKNDDDLARYLAHLGSRIVFLIDWNKARKRLRGFVSKANAIEVLTWAAVHDYGHRALLEIGGEVLLAEAVEFAAGDSLHYGARLDTLIGVDNAVAFLKTACERASLGLRHQRSRRIIADEIKADLRGKFESTGLAIFTVAARHAACGFDLAVTLKEALDDLSLAGNAGSLSQLAKRAAVWEVRGDELLNEARADITRFNRPRALLDVFEFADDAVDELEEAASLTELVALVPQAHRALVQLQQLGDAALGCAQELVKCIECAATVSRSDVRDDLDDFLASLDRLIGLEHKADDLMRQTRRVLVETVDDPRAIYLVDQLARALETATDAYVHAGQSLRSYLMEEVLA